MEASRGGLRACLKMGRGSSAGEFWVGQGGERRADLLRSVPPGPTQSKPEKTRRPESLGGKGPLAALLVGHRPLRACFLRAPCQSNPSLPNRTPPHFQTGSYSGSSIGLSRCRSCDPDRPTTCTCLWRLVAPRSSCTAPRGTSSTCARNRTTSALAAESTGGAVILSFKASACTPATALTDDLGMTFSVRTTPPAVSRRNAAPGTEALTGAV